MSGFAVSASAPAALSSGSCCIAPCSYLLWNKADERRGDGWLADEAAARTASRRRNNLIFALYWCNRATLAVKAYMMKEISY